MKLLLTENLCLKCVFISYVISLGKTSNGWYKYSDEWAQRFHYSLFGQSGFWLLFVFSKNKGFQPEALLKMPPSPTSMEIFSLDIQQQKSIK